MNNIPCSNQHIHSSIDTASYVTPTRIRKSSVVRRRPQPSAEFAEVNPELAQIPEASPVAVLDSSFILQTPHLIRSSRVVPRQRFTSPVVQPSLPQYLFESAQVEETETPRKKHKGKKLSDHPRRIVSSRVQKAPVALTSAPLPPPITFYTTFTYLTTFLHGTHTVSYDLVE